jgi:metal-sulfur cluster biosynthetic enzyme
MATKEEIIEALKTVMDPELYLDVWTLGLIYDIALDGPAVKIKMTFTSPACPAGPYLLQEIKEKILALEGVESCDVEIVFEPAWQPSDELKGMLGLL